MCTVRPCLPRLPAHVESEQLLRRAQAARQETMHVTWQTGLGPQCEQRAVAHLEAQAQVTLVSPAPDPRLGAAGRLRGCVKPEHLLSQHAPCEDLIPHRPERQPGWRLCWSAGASPQLCTHAS